MLAVSRALMLAPKAHAVDEPSFGPRAGAGARAVRDPARHQRARAVAMLLVEQNAAMALDLADRAYLIETGRVVLAGAADELKRDDGVRRAYLGY